MSRSGQQQTQQTRGRPQLPDYHSATQMAHMARRKHMGHHGRSQSCEGVLSSGFYRSISSGFSEQVDGDGRCLFCKTVVHWTFIMENTKLKC